ncbi:MAG: hypothetical protein RJQ10_09495, partial [Haliea sp.]|uniref:hypothetical protein n=1 Tax=Haliea sp. TaxID=1932666 RepID=UPI0032EAFEB3
LPQNEQYSSLPPSSPDFVVSLLMLCPVVYVLYLLTLFKDEVFSRHLQVPRDRAAERSGAT